MINPSSFWQLEEKAEDAVVAYVTSALLDHEVYVSTGFTADKPQYPAVFISAEESGNVAEGRGFDGNRTITIIANVRSSIFRDKNESFNTSRQEHADLKSRVLTVFAQTDILDLLNADTDGSITFNMANIEAISRSVNTEENYFQTSITIECYVRPVDQ